jgi:hypothetical protein
MARGPMIATLRAALEALPTVDAAWEGRATGKALSTQSRGESGNTPFGR